MARSYRRPYSAVTGNRSASWDKTTAARGVRRAHNNYLHNILVGNLDWDETPIPARLECHHNNNYSWSRDGSQRLQRAHSNLYNVYWLATSPSFWTEEELIQRRDERVERHVRWMTEIQRK